MMVTSGGQFGKKKGSCSCVCVNMVCCYSRRGEAVSASCTSSLQKLPQRKEGITPVGKNSVFAALSELYQFVDLHLDEVGEIVEESMDDDEEEFYE